MWHLTDPRRKSRHPPFDAQLQPAAWSRDERAGVGRYVPGSKEGMPAICRDGRRKLGWQLIPGHDGIRQAGFDQVAGDPEAFIEVVLGHQPTERLSVRHRPLEDKSVHRFATMFGIVGVLHAVLRGPLDEQGAAVTRAVRGVPDSRLNGQGAQSFSCPDLGGS